VGENKNDNERIDEGKGDEKYIFFKSFRDGDLSSLMTVRKFLGILWTSLTS
jgi:hypothetical protein